LLLAAAIPDDAGRKMRMRQETPNRLLRVAVVAALIALFLWQFLPSDFSVHLERRLLVAALAVQPIVLIGLIVQASRLAILAELPLRRLGCVLSALVLSQGLNLLLPGRAAELVKVSYLHANAGVPVSKGTAAIFLERSVDMIILLAISLLSLAQFTEAAQALTYTTVGVILVALVAMPLLEERLARLLMRLPWPAAATFAERFCRHVSQLVRTGGFYRALALGVATWAISVLNILVFIRVASDRAIDLKGVFALFIATTVGGAVPGLPGGIGAYEAGAILALRPYGFGLTEALAIGLIMHIAQYVVPLLASSAIMVRERTGLAEMVKRLRLVMKSRPE
jgi:uncharacterized membrane protein YbhN (UPF0104 family)